MEKQHAPTCNVTRAFQGAPEYTGPRDCICDGDHSFAELYEHRIALFISLCRALDGLARLARKSGTTEHFTVWRSKLHSDGTGYDGWFVLGINKEKDKQITYHLPNIKWDEVSFAETLDTAPTWDGHTAADVLERLKTL